MMIEPVAFRYNNQTAKNNYYQRVINGLNHELTQKKALSEFNNFVNLLRSKGVNVIVIKDTKSPDTPDSIFPNNWVSFHSNGLVGLYPMYAVNRRDERREDILEELVDKYQFVIKEIKDFTDFEKVNKFLEGTGSMIFDRENKFCYAAISIRTDEQAVFQFCDEYNNFENRKTLVVVPSSFNTVTEEELLKYNVNIVIYANHLLRSAYPAMVETARSILLHGRSSECDDNLLPIKEILELIPGTK